MSRFVLASVLGLLPLFTLAQENKPIPGIGPAGEIRKLHSGFKFTEGPAADADGTISPADANATRTATNQTYEIVFRPNIANLSR